MFKMKIASFSKISSPYKEDNHGIYNFFINVDDLPKGLPTKVNPRRVKTTTRVYKDIVNGLLNDNHTFYIENRGMFITARNVHIKNHTLYLDLGNNTKKSLNLYGVVDGGHTYHAIIHNRSKIAQDKNVYVHIEIVTGVSNIVELAKDRNTNVQVQTKAIANLDNKFNPIKNALLGTKISKKVSYTQNDPKKVYPIDVLDIISLMFSISYHSKFGNQPKAATNSHKQVLNNYLQYPQKYNTLAKFIPEFLKIYDFIEINIRRAYLKIKPGSPLASYQGFYHYRKYTHSKYYNFKTHDEVSKQIIVPIFSGLRSIFSKNKENGEYHWQYDPYIVIKKALPNIAAYIVKRDKQKTEDPSRIGRDTNIYEHAYERILVAALKLEK